MRLIDADAFKAELHHMDCIDKFGWVLIPITKLNIVLEKYTVDAVEIVRCRDCIHRFKNGENVVFNCCELNHNIVQADDWFCADGERRDDGKG